MHPAGPNRRYALRGAALGAIAAGLLAGFCQWVGAMSIEGAGAATLLALTLGTPISAFATLLPGRLIVGERVALTWVVLLANGLLWGVYLGWLRGRYVRERQAAV